MSTYNVVKPGLSNAASFQTSGKPFLTGSVSAPGSSSTPIEIKFPQVTKKVIITNAGGEELRVGFSANGVKNSNYFLIHKHSGGTPSHMNMIELEVKCSSVFLLSNHATNTSSFCLAAELTNVPASELSTNWSGSAGVG